MSHSIYRVILSAGGTGGHIAPALALAHSLRESMSVDILFVGAKKGMEMRWIPKENFRVVGLPIRGFQRRRMWRNIALLWLIPRSLWKAYTLLRDFRPHIVVGTGGYASAAVLYVATWLKVPTMIHEPNVWAGWTNRLLGRRVDKICVSHMNMSQFFPKHKLHLTGTPLRSSLRHLEDTRTARQSFSLKENLPVVLTLGGSLGAWTLNQWIRDTIKEFLARHIQLIWQTGRAYYTHIPKEECPGIRVLPFIDNIEKAYAAATLIIARAGALTVSELVYVSKPTIFVPSPNVTEDHQRKNAENIARQGAAYCLAETEAPYKLQDLVFSLLDDQRKCDSLSAKLASLRPKKWATEVVVSHMKTLSQQNTCLSHAT